jgi:hypothetical protein
VDVATSEVVVEVVRVIDDCEEDSTLEVDTEVVAVVLVVSLAPATSIDRSSISTPELFACLLLEEPMAGQDTTMARAGLRTA